MNIAAAKREHHAGMRCGRLILLYPVFLLFGDFLVTVPYFLLASDLSKFVNEFLTEFEMVKELRNLKGNILTL